MTRNGKREQALVTGASSGIGEVIARQLAQRGYDLVLVARSKDKLEALATRLAADYGVETNVFPADLSKPDAAAKLVAAVAKAGLDIDMLVNNAGVLEFGSFHETDKGKIDNILALNVQGLTSLLHAVLPQMVARGCGRVMNLSSISAFWPIPDLSTYAASKAYVLHLTESLSEEYKDKGITFTAVCPSMTETPMVADVRNEGGVTMPAMLIGDVEDVARDAIDACEKGQVVLVPGTANRLAVEASRVQPKWLLRSLIGGVTRLARKNS